MSDAIELWEKPVAKRIDMVAGWRQWADAGSMSSGLPQYIIDQLGAEQIGKFTSDSYYLFQIPGTHDLVRPVVEFTEGYPESLEIRRNEIYYSGNDEHGLVIFIGDEPHLNMEGYAAAFLEVVQTLNVQRIISFGGVYGELPYRKERMISSMYSLPKLRDELDEYAVNLSNYNGGASIGSYLCRRAGDINIEYIGFYAFVPMYDFSRLSQLGSSLRIEDDYNAWLGTMRRVNHMIKLGFSLTDLEEKSAQLTKLIDAKINELDGTTPQLNIKEYMERLEANFIEDIFDPLADVWEEELRRLLDDE